MPGKEDKSAMMHQINSNLSHQLSAGSSQAGSQHQKDTIRRAKTRTESSSSTMASKTRRRLSALLPRSDTSHARAASPHPTHHQADTNSSTQAAQGSQAIISHAHPPAEAAPVGRSAPDVAPADVGDARGHGLSLSLSRGGSGSGPSGAGANAGADADADPMRRPSTTSPKKMLLSDLYKSTKSPLARFRHQSGVHHGPLEPDYADPDLVSRDKIKQKDAVKRYLADKIRNDWEFKWPSQTTGEARGRVEQDREAIEDSAIVDSSEDDDEGEDEDDDDSLSDYSTVSEDLDHFRPRAEWLSDLSDLESEQMRKARTSAYRFSSPDTVGAALQASELERSAKRRKAVRDEMEWNSGLACFSARRDAWTGAKTVRIRSANPPTPPPQSTTPTASKRLSWFRLSSSAPTTPLSDPAAAGGAPISPTATRASGDTTIAVSPSSTSDGDLKTRRRSNRNRSVRIETLLPTPPPILPPANPMRASITPATYSSIYDRIVVSSMTPACPINLQDVIRSCVVGWKRDGEWPHRAAAAEVVPVVAVKKKRRQAGNGGGGSIANTSATRKNNSTRKDSNASRDGGGGGSGNNKPSAARRLSLGFLGKKDTNTTIGTLEAGLGGGNGNGNGNGSRRSHGEESRGLRKSLQRVLGLGHDKVAGPPVGLN